MDPVSAKKAGEEYAAALLHKRRCWDAKVKHQDAYSSACRIVEDQERRLKCAVDRGALID